MVIKDIGHAEFIGLLSLHSDLEQFIGKEVEWFTNRRGSIIGTIALGKQRQGWNYVVLKRNTTGKFHVCNVASDFFNYAAAKVDFMFAMAGAGQSRANRVPQPAA